MATRRGAQPAEKKCGDCSEDREIYGIYRDYIKHEDDLINNRVGWFIQLHSFLIATYGIVFAAVLSSFSPQNRVPGLSGDLQDVACWLLIAITAVGVASSVSAYISIQAADRAIQQLNTTWGSISRGWGNESLLPKLIGGGSPKKDRHGARFHLGLPIVLLLIWIASPAVPYTLSRIGHRTPDTTPTPGHADQGAGVVRRQAEMPAKVEIGNPAQQPHARPNAAQ